MNDFPSCAAGVETTARKSGKARVIVEPAGTVPVRALGQAANQLSSRLTLAYDRRPVLSTTYEAGWSAVT